MSQLLSSDSCRKPDISACSGGTDGAVAKECSKADALSSTPCAEDEYSYSLHMSGYASTLPHHEVDDPVAKLHAVIAEVTGKPVELKVRPRMGFLP